IVWKRSEPGLVLGRGWARDVRGKIESAIVRATTIPAYFVNAILFFICLQLVAAILLAVSAVDSSHLCEPSRDFAPLPEPSFQIQIYRKDAKHRKGSLTPIKTPSFSPSA